MSTSEASTRERIKQTERWVKPAAKPVETAPTAVTLSKRRLVASTFVKSTAEVGVKAQAAVELGFDVQAVRRREKSGGWDVLLYRRAAD